jgi:hypothetical protein
MPPYTPLRNHPFCITAIFQFTHLRLGVSFRSKYFWCSPVSPVSQFQHFLTRLTTLSKTHYPYLRHIPTDLIFSHFLISKSILNYNSHIDFLCFINQ